MPVSTVASCLKSGLKQDQRPNSSSRPNRRHLSPLACWHEAGRAPGHGSLPRDGEVSCPPLRQEASAQLTDKLVKGSWQGWVPAAPLNRRAGAQFGGGSCPFRHFPRVLPGELQPLPGAHRRPRSLQTWGPGVVVGKVSSLLATNPMCLEFQPRLTWVELFLLFGRGVWQEALLGSHPHPRAGVSASTCLRGLFQDPQTRGCLVPSSWKNNWPKYQRKFRLLQPFKQPTSWRRP